MTKLGVHGESPEEKEKEAGETVKVDPKVFTVLQPTVIPLPAQPPPRPRRSAVGFLIRGLLLFLLFIACFTAGLVLIYGVDTVYTGIFGMFKADTTTTTAVPPQPLNLVNPMGQNQRSEEKNPDEEVKIFLNSVPVAKVMVIEGGSVSAEGKDTPQKETNERPIHPYEAQEGPVETFNRPPMMMNGPPPMLAFQRQMAYAQAVRQWRMRRLQQAIYEQQMLREAMMREWMEQQRRAAAEEEMARSIAQARWEQTQRARAAEEYQAEMQRAQWAQAQRALWERARMEQMHQQMQQQMHGMVHPPFWQHPWYILNQQRQQQQQQQQQQQLQLQQQQQQQQQQPQQLIWQQPQPQYQQQQQWYFYPIYQQQQPQHPFQFQQPQWINQQLQQQQQPQPQLQQQQNTQRDIVVFPRITPPQEPQIPMRPHDASPAQILSMQQPTVPPAPEMGVHDRIYQEMQRKSQGMEFNVPSRQIWTAVTPTPESPGNYDHDAIFQENLRKIQEQQSSTASPTPVTEKVAEIKPVESDNVFRDILSVFDDAEKKDETEATTVENIVKEEEEEEKLTEAPKREKEPVSEIVDNGAQMETSTEIITKNVEIPKSDENIFKIVEEAKPDMPRPEEIHVPDPDVDEAPEPVVVEDRFPRIEDRTTVPVEATTAAIKEETDEDMEHDPLAAFLRYFEQEAQKINEARTKPAVVDSEVHKEETKPDLPPAVDEPEPHFEDFQQPQPVPRLVTV